MKSQIDNDAPISLKVLIVGDSEISSFGLTARERLARQFQRLQIVETSSVEKADIAVSGACIYGASVLISLKTSREDVILIDDEGRGAGIRFSDNISDEKKQALIATLNEKVSDQNINSVSGAELAGRYDQKLRKRTDPMVLRARHAGELEKALLDASYKGVTDFVTKHIWPAPALVVTRWCAANKISPNQVTWASAVLVVLTFWLFWQGEFVIGLITGWMMTFLDTVDGKLARVTLSSSKFGDRLDHGIDLIHPPFWWWAFAVGCAANGVALNDGGLTLAAILAGYVLQRVEEAIFILRFGIQMHIWRPFDSFFREITARRNPNLVILTLAVIAGFPREGLIAVALWTVVCLFVHLFQIIQAIIIARHKPVTSWLMDD